MSSTREPAHRNNPGTALLGASLVVATGLGGAIRDAPLFDLILQVGACILLSMWALDSRPSSLRAPALWLLGLLLAVVLLNLLYLIPLPPEIWSSLPGRREVLGASGLVGANQQAMPLSLAPLATIESLLWLLPPAAIFLMTTRLEPRVLETGLRWILPLLAASSASLALAQIALPDDVVPLLHQDQQKNQASGLFQVANHQATLQLIAIPFMALLVARVGAKFDNGDSFQAQAILLAALMLLVLAGLVATGSVAGYALLAPAVLASAPIAMTGRPGSVAIAAVIAATLGLGGAAYFVATSPFLSNLGVTDFGSDPLSRLDSWQRTIAMVQDYFPVGGGLGTWRDAFGAYEDPLLVTDAFVSHAHNDYLEVAFELGLPGVILLLWLVVWWGGMTWVIWRSPSSPGQRFRKAASIAVAVVLLHSVVDSPARTEAIACLAAFCLGVMASPASTRPKGPLTITAHRHIEL